MKEQHAGSHKPLQIKGGRASPVFCFYLIQHCFLSSHLGTQSKDAQVGTAGCRSTVSDCNVYSWEGSKWVLVPSTGIFHVILPIHLRHLCLSLCQRPCRAKGWGAKGSFYHLTCPPPLAKTHRVDFGKGVTEFANFSTISFRAVLSPRLTQAEALTDQAGEKQCIAPACCTAAEKLSPRPTIASGCPASILYRAF